MIDSNLQPSMILENKGIEFKLEKTTPQDFEDENISITPVYSDCNIPNQLWKGYRDPHVFTEEQNKIGSVLKNKSFRDFGISINNYGCAVCSSVAAVNYLKNTNYTVYDFYNKNCFVWKKSVNKNNVPNGVTLMSFRGTQKFGVTSTYTNHIAYDIGRDYGWAKSSRNYTNTNSVITPEKISAYQDKFYRPTEGETNKGYKSTDSYNQATARYTKGTLSTLFDSSDYSKKYRTAQAQAIERIKYDILNGYVDILFINSPVTKSGHYVLAVGATQNYSTHSYADITVWDPCAKNTSTYNNRTSYTGRQMTLMESMSRIKGDISDGIRSIQTCKIITYKNILPPRFEQGAIASATGTNTTANNRVRTIGYIPVEPNTQYSISLDINGTNIPRAFVLQYGSECSSYLNVYSGWQSTPYTFTTSANTHAIRIVMEKDGSSNIVPGDINWAQLESGNPTSYVPYGQKK